MAADLLYIEEASRKLIKNVSSYIEQILETTSHKTAAGRSPISHR